MTDLAPDARRPALGYAVLLGLAVAGPVAAVLVALSLVPADLATVSQPPQPLVFEVREIEVDGVRPATAELRWADGVAIAAPAWTGLVTAVHVKPGDVIRSGTTIGRVDGVDRIAMASPAPFHRTLRAGDRGPDVAMLRKALGLATSDLFDTALRQAVVRLEARLGGRAPAGVFQPAWFGWLPAESVRVYKVELQVGRPAPAPGQPVVVGPPDLAELKVKLGEDVRLDSAPYSFLRDGTAAPVPLDAALSARGAALHALRDAVPAGASVVTGRIRLTSPRRALPVPATAVLTDRGGALCVLVAAGDGYRPVTVAVAGGGVGTAYLSGGVVAGDRVLSNPGEMGLRCG